MPKNKQNDNIEPNKENETQEQRLTPEIKKSIDDIITQQKNIAREQEALTEAISKVAEKLGIKSGVLKTRISMIIKEEEVGGEIQSKKNHIDFTQEYFTIKDKTEFSK